MEHFVAGIIHQSGLTSVGLAARSGVSRSTQFRIDSGTTDPGVGTLRELAIAAGLDIEVTLRPLSDPDAGRAARVLLDARFGTAVDKGIDQWMTRLQRFAGDDPVTIVRVAGESSRLLHRDGAIYLAGEADDLKLAAAGANSGSEWILSGRGALERIGGDRERLSTTSRVIYTADVHRIIRSLSHMTTSRPESATVIVVPYSADLAVDPLMDGPVTYVAPIQALIDAFGMGRDAALVAEEIARGW
ncbi:helix-turn-helix domain-containing protein [Subtercola frigoramans]|uniref:Transcriptional regulator with XRE-family HTH domain n=1 Tax=Subtercola frigoramans TaxID=120298 RepID=A0ABS2L6X0_9MICO|nr:helix-turn-helix transcriptional regulator [Subtercola frigoramans]MBM7472231.1 transcriptional regulator with XRE-family HTH domain [Subtercola frigoramans]